jgi:hypothetical protein
MFSINKNLSKSENNKKNIKNNSKSSKSLLINNLMLKLKTYEKKKFFLKIESFKIKKIFFKRINKDRILINENKF